MNWFKHDTGASNDAKIKRLLLRYGTDGYAIYFHCLELIAADVKETNITFELEHDADIIADNLKIKGDQHQAPVDRVNEIMKYIVKLGLFECTNDVITCYKLAKRLDQSMTSNSRMRTLISDIKRDHDGVMTDHDNVMQEEKRRDKKRKEGKPQNSINKDWPEADDA